MDNKSDNLPVIHFLNDKLDEVKEIPVVDEMKSNIYDSSGWEDIPFSSECEAVLQSKTNFQLSKKNGVKHKNKSVSSMHSGVRRGRGIIRPKSARRLKSNTPVESEFNKNCKTGKNFNLNSHIKENKKVKNNINLEFRACSVNPNQKINHELNNFENKSVSDSECSTNSDDNQVENEDIVAEFLRQRVQYMNSVQAVKPKDIILNYRKKITKLSNKCIEQHFDKVTNLSKSLQSTPVIKLHIDNLNLQQCEFDKFVAMAENDINSISYENNEDLLKKVENIKLQTFNQCKLFQSKYPAYGYKSKILNYVEENEVLIISSDCTYSFNIVIPIIIKEHFPSHFIFLCESNSLTTDYVKRKYLDINNSPEALTKCNFVSEMKLLNMLSNSEFSDKFVLIISIPLKRSVELDLSIAFLRDLLCKQKNSKLILLISIFDNSEIYQQYFSRIKTSFFSVPKLILPVRTMWKKNPSENFKEDLISTALAIHILNTKGNILAFLPNDSEMILAFSLFNKKLKELEQTKFANIEGVLLDEHSDVSCYRNNINPEKRIIFFATHYSEMIPISSVCYIIDCGLKREYIYDRQKNIDILTTVFCSRARARLRKSLVGVFGVGICFRLYNKQNFCEEMPCFEHPDFLTQYPANSFLKMYRYASEYPLSVQLIQPLDKVVIDINIKQLNKLKALKDGKLTFLGKSIVKLPFSVQYSKMILTAIEWGCAFEVVILVAYFSIDLFVFKYSKNEEKQRTIDAAKLEFMQYDSDALSFLYIYKIWIKNGTSSKWCDEYFINQNTLLEIKKKVSEICQNVSQYLERDIVEEFTENDELVSDIRKILLQSFVDHFCVFSGHYKSGYRILSSSQAAFIHPSSMLCSKDNLPKFIVFNKIIKSSRSFLVGVTAFSEEFVQNIFFNNYDKILEYDYSDIFEKTLVSKTIEPVGERIMKQVLLGKKGKKLQEIEDSIKKTLNTGSIVIEPCVEKGCVFIYALESYLDAVVDEIKKILKSNVDDIINAEQVHVLELKRGEVAVPVELKCIMGAKIVSVEVKDSSIDSVLNQNKNAEKKNCYNSNSFIQCSLNLTWVRRQCKGICYITFASDDFEKAQKLLNRTSCISGSEVNFQIHRKQENTLICTEIPAETRQQDIEEALETFLPDVKCVIKMLFEPPFESLDTDTMKEEIQDAIDEFTKLTLFEIKVPKPKFTATIWTAYVNVYCTENLTSAAEKLSNVLINGYKIDAKPVYRSIINISFKLFKFLESQLKSEINELKLKLHEKFPKKDLFYFTVEAKDNPLDDDLVCMKLLSNDIAIIKQLQRSINEVLEGEILNKTVISDIYKLFCHGGHLFLHTLGRSKRVYILEECNSKTIRLYGEKKDCSKVRRCIITFLEDTESEAVETIVLDSGNNKRTLLKAIIKNYGVNLNRLVECVPKLRSATLDIKANKLLLHGNRQSIDKVKILLDEVSSRLDLSQEYSLLGAGEMCPVCATPAFNLTFRLQHCNHLYCNECIVSLITQAKIPLQCCAENCSEDIVLDDIIRILNDDDKKIKQLLQASLNYYLEQNMTEIYYCPAPDCVMFFNNKDVTPRLKCPLCLHEICTKCNVVFHYGYTCDVFQGSSRDPDYSYKVWKQATKECKECPKCKSAIERFAGCDHMTCIICHAHFCWICVKEFPKATDVYNHIPFCNMYPKWR